MFEIRTELPTEEELRADLEELFGVVKPQQVERPQHVCGYTRKSRLSEISADESLPSQAKRIQRFAHQHHWDKVKIYCDRGVSGRTSKRAGLRALKRAIRKGRVDVVIIDRLDRLSRDLYALLEFMKLCNNHGVILYSVREQVDFLKSWGRLVLYVLGGLAEFYSRRLSEEMRLIRKHEAEEGKLSSAYRFGYCTGRCSECTDLNGPGYCPYAGGPDRNDGKFRIPHPIESVAVRLAFELYATGKYSDADIANHLNEEICVLDDGTEVKFRTKGRPGVYVDEDKDENDYLWQGDEEERKRDAVRRKKPRKLRYPPGEFNRDTVRGILTNPVHTGYRAYYGTYQGGHRNGEPLKGKKRKRPVAVFEGKDDHGIVPLSLYRRVQTIRKSRYHRTSGLRRKARTYPLSGILQCSARHSPLRGHSSNGGTSRYYVDKLCKMKLPESEWHQANLRADEIEEQVADLVTQIALPESWIERVLAYVSYDEGVADLEREKYAVRTRLQRAIELRECGAYTQRRFNEIRRECERQLAELAPETQAAGREARQLLESLPALWSSLTDDELKILYQHIFDVIYTDDAGIAEVVPQRDFQFLFEEVDAAE